LDAFTPERLQDAGIRSLMSRTEQSVDPQADAVYPRQRAATVTIKTRDGRILTAHAPTRKGDPDNPLTDAELSDKFRELVGPILGEQPARRLLDTIWNLGTISDLADLI
jgi:2-methylcitrate dehydratase PrpD